jgi:valyl-tRNA synthetase
VVEPYLSEQWFVKMKPLAEPAIKAVEDGSIVFTPERWKKVYLNWMNNIRDWCISRQIWWGHRVPAWYCACGETIVSRGTPGECPKCKGKDLRQDEDVLDTWFSSWLWPFSTLGWPGKTKELEAFYPTSTLVTDPGIIFFWVARMIMAGLHFMKKIPFKDVFLNGTVMDNQGRKMSKSLGNGIDPLEVVEEFGADALRYTIVSIAPAGQNVLLAKDKFSLGRFFANKIWNAGRFILQSTEDHAGKHPSEYAAEFTIADKWILDGLEETKKAVTGQLEKFEFNETCQKLHEFFWKRFCDWYLEISKTDKGPRTSSILRYVLGESLKLLHPVMPFVTEELWSHLAPSAGSLMVQSWPVPDGRFLFAKEREEFDFISKVIYHVRNIRGEMNIEPSKRISLCVRCSSPSKLGLIRTYESYVAFLSGVESVTAGPDVAKPDPSSAAAVDEETELFVPLKGNVDLGKERQRLEKEIGRLSLERDKLLAKLNNASFTEKAPPEIVSKVRQEESELSDRIRMLEHNLRGLS